MIWLLRDLDLLSVLARAASFSFEALLLGGVAFLLLVAGKHGGGAVGAACRRGIRGAALALALSEAIGLSISSAELFQVANVGFRELVTTGFFIAGVSAILASIGLWVCARAREARTGARLAMPPLCLVLIGCAVFLSHAPARMDHRTLLALLTGAHHLGTAAWIGAMPFLLISLKHSSTADEARKMVRRYSRMAIAGAATLILAGVGMAWFYVGSWNGLYGTTYGVLLLAKIYLLLLLLTLGAANWLAGRQLEMQPAPLLTRLRRFSEVEIGLGFTALLAAASLTAQPPAVDVGVQDRLRPQQIYARLHPEPPRLTSPSSDQLTPATSMQVAIQASEFEPMAPSDAMDRAWSEYNHHWAGVIVLLAAALALLSRIPRMQWARFWPLSFAGLSLFILMRADPENWPLGPRPFWASFSAPDVLLHRAAALMILAFAIFECGVQSGKLRVRWAGMVFPAMCIAGAALLLIHDHAVQDVKEELFAEMSHTPIALMGLTAGWGRWLELRLPKGRASRAAGFLWPVFLAMAGLILLNYREM